MKRAVFLFVVCALVALTHPSAGQVPRLTAAPSIDQVVRVVIPGQPPTLVIKPDVPDGNLLCAAFQVGFVPCRTVGEFRLWVQQVQKK